MDRAPSPKPRFFELLTPDATVHLTRPRLRPPAVRPWDFPNTRHAIVLHGIATGCAFNIPFQVPLTLCGNFFSTWTLYACLAYSVFYATWYRLNLPKAHAKRFRDKIGVGCLPAG